MDAPRRFLVLLLVAALVCTAEAHIKNRKYSFTLTGGGLQPTLNDSARIWLLSPQFGVEAQAMLYPQLGIVAGVYRVRVYNDSASAGFLRFNNDRANRRWTMTSLSVGPKLYLGQRRTLTPYLVSRIEAIIWNIDNHPEGETAVVEAGDGGKTDFKATEFALSIGVGLERLFAERFAVSLATELTYFTGIGTDFAEWVNDSRSRALLQFTAGVAVHFGTPRRSLIEETERRERRGNESSRRVYEIESDESKGGAVSESREPVAAGSSSSQSAQVTVSEGDHDGDGVVDSLDACPQTAAADCEYVNATGCVPDDDHDGVGDQRDRCPMTLADEPVDSAGCTIDNDGDGVTNASDCCPDTPRRLAVDERGCPDRSTIFKRRTFLNLFPSGEANLAMQSLPGIDSLVVLLALFRDVEVTVIGYTDDVGPEEANLALSQKRAESVKAYFAGNGIAVSRLQAIGRGESNPVAPNRTRDGRELNRRIEIEFAW